MRFNPSTWEAKTGGFLSSRPAWFTELFHDSHGYTGKREVYPVNLEVCNVLFVFVNIGDYS